MPIIDTGRQRQPSHRPVEQSRGGWAFFGRLLIWSMRNSARPG
jgi:hypothetical protein